MKQQYDRQYANVPIEQRQLANANTRALKNLIGDIQVLMWSVDMGCCGETAAIDLL